jgi:hypothetical protein
MDNYTFLAEGFEKLLRFFCGPQPVKTTSAEGRLPGPDQIEFHWPVFERGCGMTISGTAMLSIMRTGILNTPSEHWHGHCRDRRCTVA